MLDFIDVQQNTDEWFGLRCGKLTSSNLKTVMANLGKSFGDPAKKYAVNIAIERMTGIPISSDYTNSHMQRGHDQEPIARAIYEDSMFCNVDNGGFFHSDTIGCSPDGLVSDCGVIEIKSVVANTQFATIKRQDIDPAYKWQCIGNLMFTGRDWLDYISYCSDFPEDKQIFVKRIYKDDLSSEFELINSRVSDFMELVDKSKQIVIDNEYFLI